MSARFVRILESPGFRRGEYVNDNNYDMRHNQFKTAANAKNIADYINTTIISCILKT